MIINADGSAWLLAQDKQANGVERRSTDCEQEEKDAYPSARCEEKRKEWVRVAVRQGSAISRE